MTTCEAYQESNGDFLHPYHITRLTKNYRSHPEILNLFSDMFYDKRLECCAAKHERERLCGLSWVYFI